jgi:argininosuccinate lyase
MADAANAPLLAATDLAEYLVAGGMPFRSAHAVVGDLVRRSLAGEGSLADLVAVTPGLGAEAVVLLEPGMAVRRRTTPGAGGPDRVAEQLAAARLQLAAEESRVGALTR